MTGEVTFDSSLEMTANTRDVRLEVIEEEARVVEHLYLGCK